MQSVFLSYAQLPFKKIILFIFIITQTTVLQAQDLVFSQFNLAPMHLNPALTGAAGAPRVMLTYRNQWINLPNGFVSYYVAADHFIEKANSGIGLSVTNDVQGGGLYSATTIAGHYAYNLGITEKTFLAMGFEGSATQIGVARNRLVFADQLSPYGSVSTTINEPLPNANKWYGDVALGAVLYSKKMYGGLALRHINAPNNALVENGVFTPIPIRLTANIGLQIPIAQSNFRKNNDDYYLSPNLMTSLQGQFYQIMGGATARLGAISAGAYLRYSNSLVDAAIVQVGFQRDVFKLGYSYDYTLSQLGTLGGTHEISLALNFGETDEWKRQHKAKRYNNCMRIFK
jgi:type IX secretion system PorP/SprF family membrane protein